MRRVIRAGGGERGEPRERAVDLQDRSFHAPVANLVGKRRGRRVGEQTERRSWVGVGDDRPRLDARAVLEDHRFARDDLRDAGVAPDHCARFLGGLRQRERDVAHPALHVAPGALTALDGAHRVHGVDRSGAGIARSRPRADQPLAVQCGAQALVLDMTLDDRRDQLLEHHFDELRVVLEQFLERGTVRSVTDPGVVRFRAQAPGECAPKSCSYRV